MVVYKCELLQLSSISTGDVALGRTYVASATTVRERTDAVALMSACISIGYIAGPCKFSALTFKAGYHIGKEPLKYVCNFYSKAYLFIYRW